MTSMHRRISVLLALLAVTTNGIAQSSMSCSVNVVDGDPQVTIVMPVPHANKMVLTTPDQRRIYLRDADTPVQFPDVDDFVNLREFVLDSNARGTWFNDWGETEIVRVLGQSGTYRLLVADDLERKNAATAGMICVFSLQ